MLTAVATDSRGAATTSAPVAVTVASGVSLPSPWADGDIGAVGFAGSASYSGGAFTVAGSGADIWSVSDQFHFVHQVLSGDGQITARVVSVQKTNDYAKVGVMIRQSSPSTRRTR